MNKSVKVLDVPYYRQIDLNSGLNSYWQNRSCGILSLKMVLDFFRLKKTKPPLDLSELFSSAIKNGGTNAKGNWLHSAFVKTAIDLGYLAWRRSWRPSEADIAHFQSEGVDKKSMASWKVQAQAESIPTLLASLEKGYPVIVSVGKNFNEIESPHAVVLTGVKQSGGKLLGFYFNDPYAPPSGTGRKNFFVPYDKLINNWYWRAIFVRPQEKS